MCDNLVHCLVAVIKWHTTCFGLSFPLFTNHTVAQHGIGKGYSSFRGRLGTQNFLGPPYQNRDSETPFTQRMAPRTHPVNQK